MGKGEGGGEGQNVITSFTFWRGQVGRFNTIKCTFTLQMGYVFQQGIEKRLVSPVVSRFNIFGDECLRFSWKIIVNSPNVNRSECHEKRIQVVSVRGSRGSELISSSTFILSRSNCFNIEVLFCFIWFDFVLLLRPASE